MIAHRIARKSATDAYTRLGLYVLDLDHPQDPRAYERLASYVVDRVGDGERVVAARVTNCETDDLEMALDQIERVQALNVRSKTDKSYHLVISFPEGERPTLDQLRDIEDHLVAAIGLSEHQRISAVHDDTDNLHIHVAINKVHPTTFRNVEPYRDHPRLMEACRELELKHGLRLDNHGLADERVAARDGNAARVGDGANKMEIHGGLESLGTWIQENARDAILADVGEAKSWSEVHQAFARHGLTLTLRPRGLVVAVAGTAARVKASSIDRSLSGQKLAERFGEFQKWERPKAAEKGLGPDSSEGRAGERAAVPPGGGYRGAPRHDKSMSKALYARYEKERAKALAGRTQALADIEQKYGAYAQQLRAHYQRQIGAVRQQRGVPKEVKAAQCQQVDLLRAKAAADRRERAKLDRQAARAAFPLPTWQKFLETEAARGDEAALAVLRSRTIAKNSVGADILTAGDIAAARHVVYQQLLPEARKNGDVVYQTKDGGRVTDRSGEVRADSATMGAAFLALSLASDRFAGQALVIDGTDAFKAAVIEAATVPGVDVRFADPVMEQARQAAVARVHPELAKDRVPDRAPSVAYVEQRNALRGRIHDIPPHRLWAPTDAGPTEYAGRRRFADGSEAVLLRDAGGIAVMPVTWRQAAKASRWTPGQLVVTDDRGRFVDPARVASQGPQERS